MTSDVCVLSRALFLTERREKFRVASKTGLK
jgi:hypothetical protein